MGKLGEATIFAQRDRGARRDRRELPSRRRAGRSDPRQRQRNPLLPPVREDEPAALHLRARLFLAAGLHRRGHVGLRSPQEHRRRAFARGAGRGRLCRAGARQRRSCGDRLSPGERNPVRARDHPLALCRPHLHPAEPGSPPPRRQAQAQRQQGAGRRQEHRAGRRFDRSRHHLGEAGADDARCRRARSAHAHRLAADQAQLLLRRRHARAREAARGADERRADARLYQRRQPRLHFDRGPVPRAWPGARRSAAAALRRLLHRRLSDDAHRCDREGRRAPRARRLVASRYSSLTSAARSSQ